MARFKANDTKINFTVSAGARLPKMDRWETRRAVVGETEDERIQLINACYDAAGYGCDYAFVYDIICGAHPEDGVHIHLDRYIKAAGLTRHGQWLCRPSGGNDGVHS